MIDENDEMLMESRLSFIANIFSNFEELRQSGKLVDVKVGASGKMLVFSPFLAVFLFIA